MARTVSSFGLKIYDANCFIGNVKPTSERLMFPKLRHDDALFSALKLLSIITISKGIFRLNVKHMTLLFLSCQNESVYQHYSGTIRITVQKMNRIRMQITN